MKKIISAIIVLCFSLTGLSQSAHAVWIWNPKTGKWSNPKYEVKGSSKEQFRHAESFEKKGKWGRAAQEYKKLVKAYPTSPLAPKALVNEANAYEKSGFYYEAYEAYQLLVEKYPSYQNIQKVVEEEYRIGNLFLSGKKRKIKFIKIALFASMESAVEIFQKVVENIPFGDLADDAQLRVGMAYEKMQNFSEAISAYKKLLKDYAKSDICDEAKYRIGLCAYNQSRGADYDQAATDKALESFKEFVREYPNSKRLKEVKNKIIELDTRKAQGLFQIAAYYDKVKDHKAAKVYYQQVAENYPESREGKLAKVRLDRYTDDEKITSSGNNNVKITSTGTDNAKTTGTGS